jgi:CRP/FNR family transcriptional regulator, anaerobic regulatory protein
MRRWQASLDEAESFITELGTGHAEIRLARLLLKLDAHSERHRIPNLLREDIAAIIGVTTETASRLMADFRRRKFIAETDERGMHCDHNALKSLV